jgi:hypothetical protein
MGRWYALGKIAVYSSAFTQAFVKCIGDSGRTLLRTGPAARAFIFTQRLDHGNGLGVHIHHGQHVLWTHVNTQLATVTTILVYFYSKMHGISDGA